MSIPPAATARDITKRIARFHYSTRRQIVIPRCTFTGSEADILALQPSGWLEEVEIKISRADFRREFVTKGVKHRTLREGEPKFISGAELARARAQGHDLTHPTGIPYDPETHLWGALDWSVPGPQLTHRFWFAFRAEIAESLLPEVPEYAGVIAVGRYIQILRKAPILKHSRKLTQEEQMRLMRLAYLRFWDVEHRELEAAS